MKGGINVVWMTLLYIIAISVVALVVAVAFFYIAMFVAAGLGFFAIAKSVGTAAAKRAEEVDLDRSIRIEQKKNREEDRQRSRQRKRRFWSVFFRDAETPKASAPESAGVEVNEPKRIEVKPKRIQQKPRPNS